MQTLSVPYPELDEYFREINYRDVKVIEARTSLRRFIAGMLSYYPWWIVLLYRLRHILVMLFGLVKHEKPERLPALKPEEIPFTRGDSATFFIVHQAKEGAYWVAETPEDKHLKAYFGVVAYEKENSAPQFAVFTTIRYGHWTGPLYFNLIRPFHHLVVGRMIKAGNAR